MIHAMAPVFPLLFHGIEPRDIWFRKISNDAAEFLNVILLIGGSLGILVLFERWWSNR